MKIKLNIKIDWQEYELTPNWERKPTDNVEINIDIDPGNDNTGYIDESRSKFSPISICESDKDK